MVIFTYGSPLSGNWACFSLLMVPPTVSKNEEPQVERPQLHAKKTHPFAFYHQSGKLHEGTNMETVRRWFQRVRFQTPNSVSLLAFTELRGQNSVSSSQPISCVPKRTHGFSQNAELSKFSLPKQCSRNSIPPVSFLQTFCEYSVNSLLEFQILGIFPGRVGP